MLGLTSPVNAPWFSQWQCCAPSWIDIRSLSITVWIERSDTNDGQTTTSQRS